MKRYYKGLLAIAAIVGSIVGESGSDKLRTHNFLFGYLPPPIQYKLEGPVAATSGAFEGASLTLMILKLIERREQDNK